MTNNFVGECNLCNFYKENQKIDPQLIKKYSCQGMEIYVLLKSLNLSKTPSYEGKLVGIKGQYLLFEDNTVFNVRANEGLVVDISVL